MYKIIITQKEKALGGWLDVFMRATDDKARKLTP